MVRMLNKSCILLFVVLLLVPTVSAPHRQPVSVTRHTASGIRSIDLVPNRNMTTAAEIYTRMPTEFKYAERTVTPPDRWNCLNLTWEHTPGVELGFGLPDRRGIQALDYITATYVANWTPDVLPEAVHLHLVYELRTTGDFSVSWASSLFELYVWAADPSDEWVTLHESMQRYRSELTVDRPLFDSEIETVFGGMVGQDGGQEDANDTIRLVLGLVPTTQFEDYAGSHPWETFNGSITWTIRSLVFSALYFDLDPESDIPHFDANGSVPIQTEHPSTVELSVAADGSVYSLYSGFEFDIENVTTFITKWTEDCTVVWSTAITMEDGFIGRKIVASSSALYIAGTVPTSWGSPLVVAKYDASGNRLWMTTWATVGGLHPVAMDIIEDESPIVLCRQVIPDGSPEPYRAVLVRFDSSGTKMWNQTIRDLLDRWHVPTDMACDGKGHIYVATMSASLTCWSYNGTQLWAARGYPMIGANADGVFSIGASNTNSPMSVQFVNSTGSVEWQREYYFNYSVVWWGDGVTPFELIPAPGGGIYVLALRQPYDSTWRVMRLERNGSISWSQVVARTDGRESNYFTSVDIAAGSEGHIYVARRGISPPVLEVGVFTDPLYTSGSGLPAFTLSPEMLVYVGVAVVAVAIPLDYLRRRRLAANVPGPPETGDSGPPPSGGEAPAEDAQ